MVLKLIIAPQPFCVALSPSVHWQARFLYCCALYNFLFLRFCQWRSRADTVLTPNGKIWLPLFWSTWSRARGQDSATCAGLAHGRDKSDCRASEEMSQKCLADELSKILENKGQQWGFFNPHPPDCPRGMSSFHLYAFISLIICKKNVYIFKICKHEIQMIIFFLYHFHTFLYTGSFLCP